VGAGHPGARGGEAARTLLHLRTHRRHAVAARRPRLRRPQFARRRRHEAIMADQYRRACSPFPTRTSCSHRLLTADGFGRSRPDRLVPRPGHKASGESGPGPVAWQALRRREPPRTTGPSWCRQRLGLGGIDYTATKPRRATRSSSCSPLSTTTRVTASWRSGGPWPRTSPGASSAVDLPAPAPTGGCELFSALGQDGAADLVAVAIARAGDRHHR